MNVAVIGASNKPERYSYKAVMLLKEYGHQVFPVHKRIKDIDGIRVYESIKDIKEELDTVTMYVAADISNTIADEILSKRPKRIILNPGAENQELEQRARELEIKVLNACTLVMLKTNQF